jgi:hypothetical protein
MHIHACADPFDYLLYNNQLNTVKEPYTLIINLGEEVKTSPAFNRCLHFYSRYYPLTVQSSSEHIQVVAVVFE